MPAVDRSEINPAYQWDLSHICPTVQAWEDLMSRLPPYIYGLRNISGTLGTSAEAMKAGLDRIFKVRQVVETAYIYAMLLSSGDNSDPQNQMMSQRALSWTTALEEAVAFLPPQILAMEEEKLEEFLKDPAMEEYRHFIENIRRTGKHTLSEDNERILALLSEAAATPSETADMFSDVDLTFPDVVTASGSQLPVTHATFGVLREDRDRCVRQQAFEQYLGAYRSFENTLATLYGGSIKLDVFKARVRNYSGSIDAALDADNVPVAVYENLIETVRSYLPYMKRYLELRRKALGVEKLHMFDLYVPLVPERNEEVSFDQAKEMVLRAVRPFGEEYLGIIRRAFDERWIDVYENRGKSAGAFSCGVYGVHPYVLLNFAGRLEDAFTLAHELGHSLHSCFSDASQSYVNHEYSIMVAEVASTVNEIMLCRSLLENSTGPARASLLNRLLEGFRTTVFRQTLFAEFEMEAHRMYESGEPVTAKTLNALYHRLNAIYYPGVELDPVTDVEWARIPHFYRPFYVYQYATGYCSAVSIAESVLNGSGAESYLDFLRMGGSRYPLDELKEAGVDLEDPGSLKSALDVFAQTVSELEELWN